MRPGIARTLAVFVVGAAVLATSARPPLPDHGHLIFVVIAAIAAWTARSSFLLLGVRLGQIAVQPSGQMHRLSRPASSAMLLASGSALPLTFLGLGPHPQVGVLLGCIIGIGVAFATAQRDRQARAPRQTSVGAWLVLDTALPAGVIAAALGGSIAVLRLHAETPVSAESIARHMAGTTFISAGVLGLGGFLKAYTEMQHGLVLAPRITWDLPGPVAVGLMLGIAELFFIPHLVPPLPLATVVIVKTVSGFLVGSALCFLGAARGARRAGLAGTTS